MFDLFYNSLSLNLKNLIEIFTPVLVLPVKILSEIFGKKFSDIGFKKIIYRIIMLVFLF